MPSMQRIQDVFRSSRIKYPIDKLRYDSLAAHRYAYMVKVVQVVEPTCFQDALSIPEWDVEMDEEVNALDENETWKLTPLLEGKKAIECKWAYKINHNANGSINKYKA